MSKLSTAALLLAMISPVLAAQGSDYYAPDRGTNGQSAAARYAWADVLRVDPVYTMVSVDRPRQECYDEQVRTVNEGNGTAGAVIGAIVGGVLGNTVGKGDGRKAATAAGAVVGGAIGHGVATRDDGSQVDTRTRCRQVSELHQERRVDGYDVEYRYHGDVYVSRLSYDPGERLRVRVSVTPAE
ncbi:MAG TPA: glycine zipper 2TM domain-containing protein [Rhodanobacteraceae bacterium]|nr:glycine zipper 2TM domain-containing protein [Rhodanobacteraceae bacterium]